MRIKVNIIVYVNTLVFLIPAQKYAHFNR